MKLERGSKLGPYEILVPLGAGGMGEVYRARDPQLGRDIAIKVLPENVSYRKERLARFENEARLASSLNHPNIVTIHSMGWENERCYIAMELIEGRTLQEMMNDEAITVDEALNIFAQVADGLARAHEAGIIHRDLKPKNIMVTKDGHAKILDFGLSKLIRSNVNSEAPTATTVVRTDPSEGLTKPGAVLGTVEYMSPEQAAGRSVDFRSDQFSMGSLMYAVLTGNLPFHRESDIQTLNQIIEGKPRSLDKLNPRVPEALQEVLRRCLMKDPGDRYASTRELAEELKKLELEGKVLLRRWTRRDWIRASAGLLILLAVSAGIWIWSQLPYIPKPESVDWYRKGVAAMHSMTFDRARRAFQQAVEIDPEFALAHASLARAYEEMEYSDRATKQMIQAMDVEKRTNLNRQDEKRFNVLQYIVMHKYQDAAPLLQQLERDADQKDKPAAALECGWLAEKEGDTEGAAKAYERALSIDPDYAAARLRLGFIQQRLGDDDQALQNFTEAQELYRNSADSGGITEALYQRANLLIRRGRAKEAMETIDNATAFAHELENQYQEIRLKLRKSIALRILGDNDQATELAQQAIDAAENNGMDNLAVSGMMTLGNALFDGGDYDSAEINFRSALKIAKRNNVPHYIAQADLALGSLYEQKNQPEQGGQFIETALPLFEQGDYRRETIQTMAVRGGIRCELGMYEEGIEDLKEVLPEAVKLQDTNTEVGIRDRLVEILQNQGNWPEALKESEESGNRSPSPTASIYALLNSAGLYWRLGRWPAAETSLAEAESILRESEDPHALALLRLQQAEMSYARGRLEQAGIDARRAISAVSADGDQAEQDARLIEALVLIRTDSRKENVQSALNLVSDLEKYKLTGKAASARLAIAEALADIGEFQTAQTQISNALEFFEQHNVWESIWRAHLVAARVSERAADISRHKNSARSALEKMSTLWPADDVNRYLQRADIKPIYAYLNP